MLVVAAVGTVVAAGLSQAQAAVALILFIVVASAGVAASLLVLAFRREHGPEIHQRWRVWLMANGQVLMRLVLSVVAVFLIAKGILGLLT